MEKGRVFKKLKKVLIAMVATIVIVFSMPIKAKATVAEDLVDLLLKIPDGVMWIGNVYLSGRASSETMEKINLEGLKFGSADEGNIYNFYITPYDLFNNGRIRTERDSTGRVYQYKVLPLFNANFFKNDDGKVLMNENNSRIVTSGAASSEGYVTGTNQTTQAATDSADILRQAISNVYKFLRNLAIVVMMLVLMYIGIRIIISSAATEQSKYKQMLIDWIVGLCLLFIMHYIMSFIMNVTEIIIDMLSSDDTQAYYIGFDELGSAEESGSGSGEEWYEFFDEYHDVNFINTHLALRAENDTGTLIQAKEPSVAWDATKQVTLFFIKPRLSMAINPLQTIASDFKDALNGTLFDTSNLGYRYYWEDWESDLENTDGSLGYSASGLEYLTGDPNGKVSGNTGIYHRTYNEKGEIVVATAQDRVIHLGNAHSDWGKNGDVTLNAIITTDEMKDGKITDYRHICIYRGNIMEYIRTISSFGRKYVHIYDDNSPTGFTSENQEFMYSAGNAILYLGLVIETLMFVFIYFKRLLQLAFMTMIAPLVAFMYPLDKVGDGKAQAFNTWFRDYLFTALLQPFHLLLYTVFITAAIDLTQKNIIYALAVYAFMIPAEKYFKKILGFEKSSAASSSGLAGAAGGLLAMRGFDKLTGLGPHGRGKGSSGSGRTRIRIPRRSGSGGGTGGAPTSSGTGGGTGGTGATGGRRGFFGGLGNTARNAANTARNARTGRGATGTRTGNLPFASGDEQNKKGLLSHGGRAIRGAVSRKLTGGKFSSLRNLNNEERRRAIFGAVGGAVGKGALKTAGAAAGAAVFGTGGAIVGAATALATGDASKFFQVAGTGLIAGARRGSSLGEGVASGIGGLVSDAQAYRAASDQDYADKLLAEDGIKQFGDNGIMLSDDQEFVVRSVSPQKDLHGDLDKLKPYTEALNQQKAELQQEKSEKLMAEKGWDQETFDQKRRDLVEKSENEIRQDINDSNQDKTEAERNQMIADALKERKEIKDAIAVKNSEINTDQLVADVGAAKSWGKLNEAKRQDDFINYELNEKMKQDHPNMEVPTQPKEASDADISARASSIDESRVRAAAEKEREAKVDAIQEQIESLDEKYDSRLEKARGAFDRTEEGSTERAEAEARIKKLNKSREKQRKELERQRAEQEAASLDIEAKKRELAKKQIEQERKAAYEREMAEYNKIRDSYRPEVEAKLRRVMAIQPEV